MDGNRGAKGSIKDRLISMLYRIRYAKKVKKEEEYEVSKKEKQVKYLQRLLDLKETENIDVLDNQDKKELDKIEFKATYKLNDNNFKINKKGISEDYTQLEIVDLNLNDIEQQTTELDEKVDLKEEIKKTKNEIVILDEVNKFINESKENIKEINEEVEYLKELSKEKNQDTEELEKRYKKLKEKVDKLKKQYDAVKEKYDLSEFSILESIKLMDNITEYKSKASLNEMDMMINVCKKEISKIERVTIEYKETKKVGDNIDDLQSVQKNIKIKFHKSKEKANQLPHIEKQVNKELANQEKIIEEMYKEASYIEKITRRQIEYVGYCKMFSSLFKIAGGILTLPFTGINIFGIALGNTMINRGLKTLNKGLEKRVKYVPEYKYTDIAYKINEVKDKVEYADLIISDNLNEIKKLKINFKEYKEYNKVLPDYEKTFEKIEKMEERLKLQQEKITKMNKKLDEEKKINSEKMKKVSIYKNKY